MASAEDNERPRDSLASIAGVEPEKLSAAALLDGVLSLTRVLARIDTTEESWEAAVLLAETMTKLRVDELEAAKAAGVELTAPVVAALLLLYLDRWDKGGATAMLRIAALVGPSQLPSSEADSNLLHWVLRCGEALSWFSLGSSEGESPATLEEEGAVAARAFRRLSRVLRSAGATEGALACAMSAVNLSLISDEVAASVDLALELAAAKDEPAVSLRLKARQADALARRCVTEPAIAVRAFDAVESVLRHSRELPEEREQLLAMLTSRVNATEALAGIRPLLRAALASATGEPFVDDTLLLLTSARWDASGQQLEDVAEPFEALAIRLENARRNLEPAREKAAAEAKWATWAFNYPPFQRAVPHGLSLLQDENLEETFLTVAHETIHVLSMVSELGDRSWGCVSRFWRSSSGCGHSWVQPIPRRSARRESRRCSTARSSRWLRPRRRLRSVASCRSLKTCGHRGSRGSPCSESARRRRPRTRGPRWSPRCSRTSSNRSRCRSPPSARDISLEQAAERRQAAADAIYRDAGLHQAVPRLRTMLAEHPAKYMAGYLAIRAVVSAWRRAYGPALDARLAFRVLLNATRFGTDEAIPDLALPAGEFRRRALAGLREWVRTLSAVSVEDLSVFREPPREGGSIVCWRGGRLVTKRVAGDLAGAAREEREQLVGACERALQTAAGAMADLERVPDADDETRMLLEAAAQGLTLQRFSLNDPDGDPTLIERMLGRITLMPIGRVLCPFWLVAKSSLLVVLLRTSEPESGDPKHKLVVTWLPERERSELEREMRARRDSRMIVARMADIYPSGMTEELHGGGINYIVYVYGDWVLVKPGGLIQGSSYVPETLAENAKARIRPDPTLDFESELTSKGSAGANRTRSWLDTVERWTQAEVEYDAARWASRVRDLAREVLDRDAHEEVRDASEVLLSTVLGTPAPHLREKGLETLRPIDPTWIGEVAQALASSADGPVSSVFLDEHEAEVSACLGPVFARGNGGWDVRPIEQEV